MIFKDMPWIIAPNLWTRFKLILNNVEALCVSFPSSLSFPCAIAVAAAVAKTVVATWLSNHKTPNLTWKSSSQFYDKGSKTLGFINKSTEYWF